LSPIPTLGCGVCGQNFLTPDHRELLGEPAAERITPGEKIVNTFNTIEYSGGTEEKPKAENRKRQWSGLRTRNIMSFKMDDVLKMD
jgi:hypothetical protein